MTDPIADMLTRLRNAGKVRHRRVDLPASRLKVGMAEVLLEQKFIASYKVVEDGKQNILRIYLKYTAEDQPVLQGLRRISTPGRRVYVRANEVPSVRRGLGVAILSTPLGLLTDAEARRERVGGEVIAYVW